jgi:hypothetical protein
MRSLTSRFSGVSFAEKRRDGGEPAAADSRLVDPQHHQTPPIGIVGGLASQGLVDDLNLLRRRLCRRAALARRVGRRRDRVLVVGAAAQALAARYLHQPHMLAVVGHVAGFGQPREQGIARAAARLLAADEGAARQHGGDQGDALALGEAFLELPGSLGLPQIAADVARRPGWRGARRRHSRRQRGPGGRARHDGWAAKLAQLLAMAGERRVGILPQARLDRRLGKLQALGRFAVELPPQVEAVRRQERRPKRTARRRRAPLREMNRALPAFASPPDANDLPIKR